jgi:hypothetical protein
VPKADQILGFFPAVYRARDPRTLLGEVVRALARPIEEADTQMFRIQRAHRLRVAEFSTDIVRLAASMNLTPYHFEDLTGADLDAETLLRALRDRVQRVARIHLRGLGTPPAVLEAAAAFINSSIVPREPGAALIRHLDADGFSHEATVEFGLAPDKLRSRITIHENPFRRQKVEPAERWPGDHWPVDNKNSEPSPVRVVITGVGDRTVRPVVFCEQSQEGVMFDGSVPDGATLVMDAEGSTLDNVPIDQWVVSFKGAAFDLANVGAGRYATAEADDVGPFWPEATIPPYQRPKSAPRAPVGPSDWHIQVAQGGWDGSEFDLAVFATPDEPIGQWDRDFNFDQCVFDVPPSAVAGLAWNERVACAFKLLLPPRMPESKVNYAGRVAGILPRFKGAGIRTYVETAPDSWVLGESVLRPGDGTKGAGVDFNSTTVRAADAELYVPLDRSPSVPATAEGANG